jgi:hypothetical protein
VNKEELTRELEYTEKKHRHDTVNTFDTDISMMCVDVLRVLKNCIEIPNNATNGDMIMAMFPNIDFTEMAITVHATTKVTSNGVKGSISYDFWKDWWKTKYKGAGEIQCIPTDEEIAKSFIEDVEAVKDLLPRTEREDKCSKCEYYINPDYTRCKECGAERSDKE